MKEKFHIFRKIVTMGCRPVFICNVWQSLKKMKAFRLVRILIVLSISLSGELLCQPDYLQPVNGVFDTYKFQLDYYLKVREMLLDSLPGLTEIQFIEIPSWGPEEALIILGQGDNNYEIHYRTTNQSIYYSEYDSIKPIIDIIKYYKTIDMMKIEKIIENKKHFLDLLLLADEQEDMIDKYLPNGDLFALYDDDLKSVCVVVPINSETCELKNIATYEKYQGKGYGRALINYISDFYKNDYKTMLVGTGETPTILSFYESCGFEISYRVKNFFTDNYDHPMFEGDIQLIDMIYLKKDL